MGTKKVNKNKSIGCDFREAAEIDFVKQKRN